jgi:hypothetical protein
MAADMLETHGNGLNAFSADDEFDLMVDRGSVAVAQVAPSDPCDPSGGDPSGGTVCFDPSGGLPTVCITAPAQLVTAEDGSADLFEMYSGVDPSGSHFYQIASTNPGEALPTPAAVVFGADACTPQAIWVVGQNDGVVDGDQGFGILIRDENGHQVAHVEGVNLDNDAFAGAYVDVDGPATLPIGGTGQFDILVQNVEKGSLTASDLVIQPTPGLEITNYAAALLSGDPLKVKGRLKDGTLSFERVSLNERDGLLVTIDVILNESGPAGQKVSARFVNRSNGVESDSDQSVGTNLP